MSNRGFRLTTPLLRPDLLKPALPLLVERHATFFQLLRQKTLIVPDSSWRDPPPPPCHLPTKPVGSPGTWCPEPSHPEAVPFADRLQGSAFCLGLWKSGAKEVCICFCRVPRDLAVPGHLFSSFHHLRIPTLKGEGKFREIGFFFPSLGFLTFVLVLVGGVLFVYLFGLFLFSSININLGGSDTA